MEPPTHHYLFVELQKIQISAYGIIIFANEKVHIQKAVSSITMYPVLEIFFSLHFRKNEISMSHLLRLRLSFNRKLKGRK